MTSPYAKKHYPKKKKLGRKSFRYLQLHGEKAKKK